MRSVLLALVLAACARGPRRSEVRSDDTRAPALMDLRRLDKPYPQAVHESDRRMHERFAATEGMRLAIARSDLRLAQEQAQVIADLEEPDLLPAWKPFVDDIRTAARAVGAAPDPAAAARTMAVLGRACGRCHEAAAAKLGAPAAARPASEPGHRDAMASHHWAAGLMWQGIILPSTERWQEGAQALTNAPLTIVAEADTPSHHLGVADDVARIRLLARRAETTTDLDRRAELYGELLGTCVRCHQTIRDR